MDAAVCRVSGDDGELWMHVRRDLRERMQLQQGADKVSVAVTHVAGTIDSDAAHLVHRVAQEVVTEVCAAEMGASIDIRVWQEGAHIRASITDDVVRADEASTEQKELMLAYRAESLGATIDTVTLANGGRCAPRRRQRLSNAEFSSSRG